MSVIIEHAIHMIHGKVSLLKWELSHADCYCDGLALAARAGHFLHPESLEAINLANDVKELRRLASELEAIRASLIANAPAEYLQAAE